MATSLEDKKAPALKSESTRSPSTSEFIAEFRNSMVPVNKWVSYFTAVAVDENERSRLVTRPVESFPPKLADVLPKLRLVLVPFLEFDAAGDPERPECRITYDPPEAQTRRFSHFQADGDEHYLFLSVKDESSYDAHVHLFRVLAKSVIDGSKSDLVSRYNELLQSELDGNVHGEAHDDHSWNCKQDLLRSDPSKKDWADKLELYRSASLEDTLLLYLHGLCCDIEVDAGPKQLASRHLRSRLLLIKEHLPPPKDVALFPEEFSEAN